MQGTLTTYLFNPLLLQSFQPDYGGHTSDVDAKRGADGRYVHASLHDLSVDLFPKILAQDTLRPEVLVERVGPQIAGALLRQSASSIKLGLAHSCCFAVRGIDLTICLADAPINLFLHNGGLVGDGCNFFGHPLLGPAAITLWSVTDEISLAIVRAEVIGAALHGLAKHSSRPVEPFPHVTPEALLYLRIALVKLARLLRRCGQRYCLRQNLWSGAEALA